MQIKLIRIYIVFFYSIVVQRKKFPMEKTERCAHVYLCIELCFIDCCFHNSKLSKNEVL